jgi:outer membrane protein TolC
VSLSIEEIAKRAQSRNLEILKSQRSVEQARKDFLGEPELMGSRLSVGGGYTSGGIASGGWYGQSSLSLPVTPQLSLGGEISVDDTRQFGEELTLSVEPFAPGRQTYAEEKNYRNAEVRERYLRQRIYFDAEQAALNLLVRDMERELARSTVELEQKKYELVQRLQELGEASFQDVQDQLVDLITWRQNLFNSEQRYLSDWKTLQLLFAPSEERIAVVPVSLDEVLDLLALRSIEAARFVDTEPSSEKLESLRFELIALQTELKVTLSWRPELELAAGVAFPDVSPSVSLSLSFSPDQLKLDEREELAADIEVKRMEIATESYNTELQKTLGEQSVEIVEEALVSTRVQKDRDGIALQEAELLYQQGKRTTLELEQLRLNLERAEILSFQAAVEVYRAQGNYLMLFVND